MYPIDRRYTANHIYSITKSLRFTAKLVLVSLSTVSRCVKKKIYETIKES